MPNTQTSVPLYASGEVLTAANLNLTNSGIPVFATTVTRDAAFGGANEKVLAEGQFAYIEATNTTQYYDGSTWQSVGASKFVQQVVTQTGAMATGTTLIPIDNTIPQNTEGNEYMTLAITPTSATNLLLINVIANCSSSVANSIVACLFQDSTANALATVAVYQASNTGFVIMPLNYRMTAGTTSATTFKIRIGCQNAGTTTFNGAGGGAFFGSTFASSIIITEITP